MPNILLTQDVVMNLDGQLTIVQSGSVIAVSRAESISPSHGTVLAEAEGTIKRIAGVSVPTSVRGMRRK